MIAIIPIFLKKNDIWHSLGCHHIFPDFMAQILECSRIKKIRLITNDSHFFSLAAKYESPRFQRDLIPAANGFDKGGILPHGTLVSLRQLASEIESGGRKCLILNHRNPLITKNLLKNALARFAISRSRLMISVIKSEDHPCQLKSYIKNQDVGIVYLDDDTGISTRLAETARSNLSAYRNQDLFISRSFPFKWGKKQIIAKSSSGLYFRRACGTSAQFCPVEEADESKLLEPVLYHCEPYASDSARVIFPTSRIDIPTDLRLVGCTSPSGPFIRICILKDKEQNYYVHARSKETKMKEHFLSICPVCKNLKVIDKIIIEDAVWEGISPFSFNEREVSCLIYTSKTGIRTGTYDIATEFPIQRTLWDKDINTESGEYIFGRQAFPDVFEPDGSLLIAEDYRALWNGLSLDGAEGYCLQRKHSILIHSDFDLLRFKAKCKAKAFVESEKTHPAN